MRATRQGTRRNRRLLAVLVGCVVVVGTVLSASSAAADEPGETTVGYLLVQQALAHLAHDSTSVGIEVATEKVDDALATSNRDGVDVSELRRAMAELEAGQIGPARTLLQGSIVTALDQLGPAIGEETGTKVVLSPLPGRSGIAGTDRMLLGASVVLLLLGVGLAWHFRPRDTIEQLRRQLNDPTAGQDGLSSGPSAEDAS